LSYNNFTSKGLLGNLKSLTHSYTSINDEYNRLKQTEGDILGYFSSVQENNLNKNDAALMLQYIHAVRQSIFAAKSIKDIAHNLNYFESSANDFLHQQVNEIYNEWNKFEYQLNEIMNLTDKEKINTEIEKLSTDSILHEEKQKTNIITLLKKNQLNEIEASTLMNVFRELRSGKKSLLLALHEITTESAMQNNL
jgi:hypothetical protein